MPFVHDHPEGLLIEVRVQPRSSRNAVVGVHDKALKIKLNAPPVEGKANKALVEAVAGWLHLPKSAIAIVAGETSRGKRLLVRLSPGSDFEARRRALRTHLEQLAAPP